MPGKAEAGRPRGATGVLRLLYEVTHEFSSTLELPAVLAKVLALTVRALGAAQGSLFMLDEQGRVIRDILARKHLPPEVRERVVAVVMDRGLAGWVHRQQTAALVLDTETDERWVVFPDDTQVIRSAMSAPLIRRDQVSGIITLMHPKPHAFAQADLQILTAIAQQAAAAIENARLFTEVSQERDAVAAVLYGVRDAILVTRGIDHRLAMVNPAAALLFGLDQGQAVGRVLTELGPPPDLVALFDRVSAGQPLDREIAFPAGRHFHALVQVVPRVGTVAALHDITHFKELDAIKSEFVEAVSHDLKNPLSTIQGYSWLLGEEQDLSPEQRQYVSAIQDSVARMQRLVEGLLDLSRIEAGIDATQEFCSLAAIAGEVAQAYSDEASAKGIQVETRVAGDLPPILANRLRVSQAISNLVSNAVKFTPPDGRVRIEVSREGDTAVVAVVDNGPGIAAVDQAKLFQKFARIGGAQARAVSGTGLGLAIVRSVVESLDGRVWVESQPGTGSTFFIQLPLKAGGAGPVT